jgi:Lon protease-like protein
VQELAMFPLGTVLFPHMVLPLHLFEPRYLALIADVLAGDREFGVTLIERGHEVGGEDERSSVGTVARVLQAEELEDGRWLVISVGVRRIRVERWLDDRPYPRALVTELPDEPADDVTIPRGMVPRLRRVLAMHTELGHEGVPATFEVEADPNVASWQTAVVAPLTPFDAQRVLVAPTCEARLTLLDDLLEGLEEVLGFQLRADGSPTEP